MRIRSQIYLFSFPITITWSAFFSRILESFRHIYIRSIKIPRFLGVLGGKGILPSSGVMGVELLGGSPINSPHQSYFFCLLVWDACRVVGTTGNDRWSLRNTVEWMGRYKPPSSSMVKSWWKSKGAYHLEAPKNLHLMVPKSRSIIAQEYVDGYAFFHVHGNTKSQENPKGPKFSILKFLSEKKCVCSIVPAGQYFSNLKLESFKFKSHRSVPRSTLHVTTSE